MKLPDCPYDESNMPTWIRTLLEENERLTKERDAWYATAQEALEIVEPLKSELISLRSQLAEKDKVLEMVEDWARNDIAIRTGNGQRVGTPKFTSLQEAETILSILSRYKENA